MAFPYTRPRRMRRDDFSRRLMREHRLYQADWLMRHYGFRTSEILAPEQPNLDLRIDPKLAWALRNRHRFAVDGYHLCSDTQCQVYSDPRQAGIPARAGARSRHARPAS